MLLKKLAFYKKTIFSKMLFEWSETDRLTDCLRYWNSRAEYTNEAERINKWNFLSVGKSLGRCFRTSWHFVPSQTFRCLRRSNEAAGTQVCKNAGHSFPISSNSKNEFMMPFLANPLIAADSLPPLSTSHPSSLISCRFGFLSLFFFYVSKQAFCGINCDSRWY